MDNVTNIEPADNEERLLKGILEGDTETNIEPAGNKERLLKAILENGGGGGATSVTLAASGDNLSGDISLADLKTALSNGVVLLSFPTEGNADERVVAEYTDDSTNGLRIGVFSEDEYIVYSVVDNGNDGVTLTVVSESEIGGSSGRWARVFTVTPQGDNGIIANTTAADIKTAWDNGPILIKSEDAIIQSMLGKSLQILDELAYQPATPTVPGQWVGQGVVLGAIARIGFDNDGNGNVIIS